jgi:hypothetical protein
MGEQGTTLAKCRPLLIKKVILDSIHHHGCEVRSGLKEFKHRTHDNWSNGLYVSLELGTLYKGTVYIAVTYRYALIPAWEGRISYTHLDGFRVTDDPDSIWITAEKDFYTRTRYWTSLYLQTYTFWFNFH